MTEACLFMLQVGRQLVQKQTWVMALSWTTTAAAHQLASDDCLLLAAGCADGSVHLMSIAPSAPPMHESSQPPNLMVQRCSAVLPPDLLGLHCLDVDWMTTQGDISVWQAASASANSCACSFLILQLGSERKRQTGCKIQSRPRLVQAAIVSLPSVLLYCLFAPSP